MGTNRTFQRIYKLNLMLIVIILAIAFVIGLSNNAVLFTVYFAAVVAATPLVLTFLLINIWGLIKKDSKCLYSIVSILSLAWIAFGIFEIVNMTLP